jgi:glycine dehydrogenase subunit 2
VPEPITPEPAESFSKADLDTFGSAFADIARRAQADPDEVLNGPYHNACRRIDAAALDDPDRWVPSSRAQRTRDRTPVKGD